MLYTHIQALQKVSTRIARCETKACTAYETAAEEPCHRDDEGEREDDLPGLAAASHHGRGGVIHEPVSSPVS